MRAARKLFAQNGFSATSMQKIADQAKVNQALLYHHFDNKQTLWKIIKQDIVKTSSHNRTPYPTAEDGLLAVVTFFVEQRTNLFLKNPMLVRIIQWQRLEPQQEKLISHAKDSPFKLIETLKDLQDLGFMKKSFDPSLVMAWLLSSIYAIVESKVPVFHDNVDKIESYKKMLIEHFYQLLKT